MGLSVSLCRKSRTSTGMDFKTLAGQDKFDALRQQYSYLEYVGFSASVAKDTLKVEYHFSLDGKMDFRPGFEVARRKYLVHFPTAEDLLDAPWQNLFFHIGMIELISYWKAACPPLIRIRPHQLDARQVQWWKKVYFNGLGEFFHVNGIKATFEDFCELQPLGQDAIRPFEYAGDQSIFVPIGGGKDSVVSLELLKRGYSVRPFILNPRGATLECVRVAGYGNDGFIEVQRRLDQRLLQLNAEGYLNGHTPFSALLAFYCLMAAYMAGQREIALSNESSANEPTVAGTEVNHQYSKSYAFEKDFREYVASYVSPGFDYFSLLRPLNELRIAQLFARQVKYYPVFKSCNAGSKTDSWCCSCPKCLFAFLILSPFIPMIELVAIFGENLFDKPSLLPYLKELCGLSPQKPFECVGTVDEVNAALQLFMHQNSHNRLPLLIDYYSNSSLAERFSVDQAEALLSVFDEKHFVPEGCLALLNEAIV